MITYKRVIQNPLGLHAAYVAEIAAWAKLSSSSIYLRKPGRKTANAKDVVALLGLMVKAGEELELLIDGDDEIEEMKHMAALMDRLDLV